MGSGVGEIVRDDPSEQDRMVPKRERRRVYPRGRALVPTCEEGAIRLNEGRERPRGAGGDLGTNACPCACLIERVFCLYELFTLEITHVEFKYHRC